MIRVDYLDDRLVDVRSNRVINPNWTGYGEPKRRLNDIDEGTTHHDASHRPHSYSTLARIESHARYHSRKWGGSGLSYHVVIDNIGQIWLCRDFNKVLYSNGNAHSNRHALVVVLDGNGVNQEFTREQYEALGQFWNKYGKKYRIEMRVFGHREKSRSGTACPSDRLLRFVKKIRSKKKFTESMIPKAAKYDHPDLQPKPKKPAPKPKPKPVPELPPQPKEPSTPEYMRNVFTSKAIGGEAVEFPDVYTVIRDGIVGLRSISKGLTKDAVIEMTIDGKKTTTFPKDYEIRFVQGTIDEDDNVWGITEYSASKKIWNGVFIGKIVDGGLERHASLVPKIEPPADHEEDPKDNEGDEPPQNQPDPIEPQEPTTNSLLAEIKKLLQKLIELITKRRK